MSAKASPTAAWLEHHLNYEVNMLSFTLRMAPMLNEDGLCNAVIESCCIHLRALIEFFEKERLYRNFTVETYEPFHGVSKTWLTEKKRRVNNQVAHLSVEERTADVMEKISQQERVEIARTISDELKRFRHHLKPDFAMVAIDDVVVETPYLMSGDLSFPRGATGPTGTTGSRAFDPDVTSKSIKPKP